MVRGYDPQVDFCQGGVRESSEVDAFRMAKVISGGLGDGACELGAADAADAHRLEGDCAGNLLVGAELRAMSCGRVCGYYERIVLLIPGIEARCAPRSLIADGGDAQQVVPAEKRSDSFVQYFLFHAKMSGISSCRLSNPVRRAWRRSVVSHSCVLSFSFHL